jgi:hypothetical protein
LCWINFFDQISHHNVGFYRVKRAIRELVELGLFMLNSFNEKLKLGPTHYMSSSMRIEFAGSYLADRDLVHMSISDLTPKSKLKIIFLSFIKI